MMTRKPSDNDLLPHIWSKRNKVLRRGVCKLLMAVKGSGIDNIPSERLKALEVRLLEYRRHGYKTATVCLYHCILSQHHTVPLRLNCKQ